MGGDEFAIIQFGVEGPQSTEFLARRLVQRLSAPYVIAGHELRIGASVGVALAGPECEDVDRLLLNADVALYRAKNEGRCTWRLFEPQMTERANRFDACPAPATEECASGGNR
jgi:diguanylate cyclase (GGDEF)-like protein